ncbi:GIY-YIG nuclease family protein [Turicibacter sanguinis]|uniref:GIY-YIG nuclease family protein n=1 Tax=Turicibacter sanguinis TaxID=154288 RepID=UPI00189D3A64|nr:GIY-YIG nuclease family protein [Turicibacter sanguinis]
MEDNQKYSFEDIFEHDELGLFEEEEEQAALELESILTLKHVTPVRNKYDSGKGTKPCEDFEKFKYRFEKCHSDLKQGRRKLIEFKGASRIEVGNFYLLGGQLAYVDNLYNVQKKVHGRIDARLRLIFENGTESDMLRNSLERRLYEKNGKAITELEETNQDIINQRMQGITQDDKEVGYIYILKSKSQNYEIASIENLYKIGLARESVEKRIKNAHKETTYLSDEVELIAQYKCYNLNLSTLENLIHRFFAEVRLDVSIVGQDGRQINPKEWFIVPLEVINEAMGLLINGTIVNYRYDKEQQKIVLRD